MKRLLADIFIGYAHTDKTKFLTAMVKTTLCTEVGSLKKNNNPIVTILEQLSHIAIVSFYKGTELLVPFLSNSNTIAKNCYALKINKRP